MKKEVKVTFETITPLWTGGAWGECKEIKPSSLLGSLRFWFELICYFSGVCNENDFNFSLGRFEKEVNREDFKKLIKKNGNDVNEISNYLYNSQKIPIPAIIFGTTNWRSLIEIKNITPLGDYCFGNRLNLPYAIAIEKSSKKALETFKTRDEWRKKISYYSGKNFKHKLNNAKKEYSFFFFQNPYFYGKFEVVFKVEETILEPIFYPLLNFMDQYGFWGGKWNIGYGRLKILNVEERYSGEKDWKKEEFDFNMFKDNEKKETLKIEKIEFKELIDFIDSKDFIVKSKNKEKKILIFEKMEDRDVKNLIKELLKEKIILRREISDKKLRHYIFGKTEKIRGEDLPQGSKILPYIWKETDNYNGGFISIAGILKLYYGE